MRRFAGWTVEVFSPPGLGANTGALRGALVTVEAGCGEMQVHAGIRSRVRMGKEEASRARPGFNPAPT